MPARKLSRGRVGNDMPRDTSAVASGGRGHGAMRSHAAAARSTVASPSRAAGQLQPDRQAVLGACPSAR